MNPATPEPPSPKPARRRQTETSPGAPALYPGAADADHPEEGRTRPSWKMIAIVVIIALVFVLVVIAHLTGAIGPGVHQPSS